MKARSSFISSSSGIVSVTIEWCFWYDEITCPTKGQSEGRKVQADSTAFACHFSLSFLFIKPK